ncbi:MAG: hypothetical protein R3C32_06400 [Chloroflexota bacterium]
MALDLSNRMTVEVVDGPSGSMTLTVEGEGAGILEPNGTDRFTTGLRTRSRRAGRRPRRARPPHHDGQPDPLLAGPGSSAVRDRRRPVAAGGPCWLAIEARALVLACQAEGHADRTPPPRWGAAGSWS